MRDAAPPNATVLVVSFTPWEMLARYRDELALPFQFASDPERNAYRAYGLHRAPASRIWHPLTLLRYLRLLAGGMKLRRPRSDEDLAQLGGDFVIDGTGIVRFAHPSRRPDDRPSSGEIFRAVVRST